MMGKLIAELLKAALKLLPRQKRAPQRPKDAQRTANERGSNDKDRETCKGSCPAKKKAEKRDTKQYADRLKGKKYEEAESLLDKELRDDAGWNKAPLSKGDGVRYYDGKGGAVSLNRGYPEGLRGGGGDAVHRGPYVKIQPSGDRVPLGL